MPKDARVSEATLTLTCTNGGAPITVSYANSEWQELMVRWTTRPALGAVLDTVTCVPGGEVSIDLTEAFRTWVSGSHAAHGIYLRSDGIEGTDFGSSEAAQVARRPRLRVTYALP